MTESICQVATCANPSGDGFVCRGCLGLLEQELAEIPWLADELRAEVKREVQHSNPYDSSPSTSAEVPVPVNLKAARILDHLANELGTWCRYLVESRPEWRLPRGTPSATSAWLLLRLETIRCHPAAGEQIEALTRTTASARWAIDRPPDRWFAGVCSALTEDGDKCPEDLYAKVESGVIQCRKCRTTHDIAKRRDVLLEAARDVLATASEAARAVVVWSDYSRGETRLVRRIGAWVDRGRLQVRGHRRERGTDRPTYRIGDILVLLETDPAWAQGSTAKDEAC